MKKAFLVALLASVVVFGLFAQTGVIREMTGEVELKPSGASVFTAAVQGSEVAQDTIVSTGFKSTAVIEVGSSVITVRPLTRLSLAEISSSSGTENTSVKLQTGRVRVDVKPPAGTKANFTVQSPSATASVRGTSFEMDTRNLDVDSGTVAYAGNLGASALVKEGGSSSVGDDGAAGNPNDAGDAALLPPAPVGTDGGLSSLPPAPADGDVDIGLVY